MRRLNRYVLILVAVALLAPAIAFAAAKKYQVTGKLVEMSDTMLVVDKDDEQWQIVRDPKTTKVSGDLKLGAKVTIKYQVVATEVEVRTDAGVREKVKGVK